MNERSARALLGVSPSATAGQIKRAYRRLALDVHPDRGGDPAAFQRLVEAQHVLLEQPSPAVRGAWLGAASVRVRTAKPLGAQSPRRRPQPAEKRDFGDILAEKLAAA